MNKLLLYSLIILVLFCFTNKVLSAPYYYYPQKYEIVIKNIKKSDIQKIEPIYASRLKFNYSNNQNTQYWISNTDFGKKYRGYNDSEIIPKLSEKQIDEIAKIYNGYSDDDIIEGYWIDTSQINANISNGMVKFGIVPNSAIKYQNDTILISYILEKNYNDIYLRIVKNDNTILYSNKIKSNMSSIIDENSTKQEREQALEISAQTAYFEVDFSKIKNKFDVVEIERKKKHNYSTSLNIQFILLITILIFSIMAVLFKLKSFRNQKKIE